MVEFNGHINNIFSDNTGQIQLKINDKTIDINVSDDNVEYVGDLNLTTDVIYVDNPFILDELFFHYRGQRFIKTGSPRQKHLKSQLSPKNKNNTYEEIIREKKLKSIMNTINDIVPGNLVNSGRSIDYGIKNTKKTLDVKNLSTGIKTFVILKQLILNGVISDNVTLILDEPEIHLHPEWQLIFAELIVLMQKTFDLHILLTTHSPYFFEAIEVFSKKYEIEDKCNYYISSKQKREVILENINGELERVYKQLARPLQNLENQRYNNDDE